MQTAVKEEQAGTLMAADLSARVHELLPQLDSDSLLSHWSQKLVPQPLPRQSDALNDDPPHVRWKHPADF